MLKLVFDRFDVLSHEENVCGINCLPYLCQSEIRFNGFVGILRRMSLQLPSEPITSSLDRLEAENFEKKEFIPFNRLQLLLTHDKILELLQQNGVDFHSINEISDRVLHGGLRTLAILAKIHDIESITRFIKADQFHRVSLDSVLPLSDTEAINYLADPEKRSLFLRKQWIFLAPVFSEDPIPRELHGRTILPFLRRTDISEGGFGKVYKVRIDASHHQFSSIKTEVIPKLLVLDFHGLLIV